MSGIQHVYTLNPVTALAFYRPFEGPLSVLVGEGVFLKVFEASTAKLLAQCKVFNSQTVHGIAVRHHTDSDHDLKVVIWGGKSFVLLSASEVDAIISSEVKTFIAYENLAPDWILDGTISPFQAAACCMFVTAHSATLRVTLEGSPRRLQLKSLSSLSQSILYSAHIVWTSADSIMVAAGTVFGEIEVVLWQLISDDDAVNTRQLFTLTGHEGSIFGVRLSPEIIDCNGIKTRLLASCSDDRTIRIWDVSLPLVGQIPSSTEQNVSIRETGFSENGNIPTDEISTRRSVAIVMAHASRIWRVEFLTQKAAKTESPTEVNFLSFGEDSTCQYWSMDLWKGGSEVKSKDPWATGILIASSAPTYAATITHLNTFAYHTGKHIWSAGLLSDSDARRHLVTGGADGKVAMYDIIMATPDWLSTPDVTEVLDLRVENSGQAGFPGTTARNWTLEEILLQVTIHENESDDVGKAIGISQESLEMVDRAGITALTKKMRKHSKIRKDSPNKYAFVTRNELLITTSAGRVLLGSIRQQCTWQELKLPGDMNHDLLSYSIVLGIPDRGTAFFAGANGTIYMYNRGGAIMEIARVNGKLAALFDVSNPGDDRLHLLATTLGSSILHLFTVSVSDSQTLIANKLAAVTLPPNFVVTSAGDIRGLLVLGARNGSLAVYDVLSTEQPLEVFRDQNAQRDDAVTTIINVPSASASSINCHFLVTSRNGSYSIFSLSVDQGPENLAKKISLALVHQSFPPFGPMIENAWFNNCDLLLHGFRNKSFVVWNETQQCDVTSIECGGAHRSYAYSPSNERGGAGHFAYTKASKLYLHSQHQPSHKVLKPGGHGREIKACAYFYDAENSLVATGAEDTTIRIWRHHKDNEAIRKLSLECCAVIQKHTAGIQHLQWAEFRGDVQYLFSASGNEEFYVWAISSIPGFGIGVVCEATLTDQSEDKDLRIMSFDVHHLSPKPPCKLPIGAMPVPDETHHITLVYSDSTIKAYHYSRVLGFRKVAQARYTSACLTQVNTLSRGKGLLKCFTTATDGHLVLWEHPPQLPNSASSSSLDIQSTTTSSSDGQATNPNSSTSKLTLLSRTALHQSSISAMDVLHLTLLRRQGGILVATAGDDNALALTLFYNLEPVRRITVPSAHAAAITGVSFRSDSTGGLSEGKWIQLWTIGCDQRLKRWVVELDNKGEDSDAKMETGLNMRVLKMDDKRDDVWCSVADPGGLVAFRGNWREDYCLVYGNGLELFKLKDRFPNGEGHAWEGYGLWDMRSSEGL